MRRIGLVLLWLACARATCAQTAASPSGNLSLSFGLNRAGEAVYQLSYKGRTVIAESKLGLAIKNQPALDKGFVILDSKASEVDETWEPVWGEVARIRNRYRELLVTLRQTAAFEPASNSTTTELFSSASDGPGKAGRLSRTVAVRFRLFDDGLGFRYEFPEQGELKSFTVQEERTELNLAGNHKAFWIPGDYDTNEYAYTTSRLSEVDAFKGKAAGEIATRVLFADDAVQTPLMLKSDDGLYINIHEAALVDYPAMYLRVDRAASA